MYSLCSNKNFIYYELPLQAPEIFFLVQQEKDVTQWDPNLWHKNFVWLTKHQLMLI